METFLSLFTIALFVQAIRISVPYVLAALGGTFSERGGVVNIALEGMLLTGAFSCVVATYYAQGWFATPEQGAALAPWIGVIAALVSGLALGLVLALATVGAKADQIICGLAINIFAAGATRFALQPIFGSNANSATIPTLAAPEFFAGRITHEFNSLLHPLVVITILLVVASHFVLYHTPFGLRLRAVGEHPEAADTLGVSVWRMRYGGVLLGSAIAGLGGAWMALDQALFTHGMSAGRGYIALAAMIVGKWTPFGAFGACLLFGFAEAFQIRLQTQGLEFLPSQIVQMIPYLLTILVIAGFIGRATPPAADGVPYEKEAAE